MAPKKYVHQSVVSDCWLRTPGTSLVIRVASTHGQMILERWRQEKVLLTPLPMRAYDTAIKVYRKVYKDCQVAYGGNRYIVPPKVVGRRILLKIKDGVIRFFHDDELLATYNEPDGKHQLIGDRRFYEQLKREHGDKPGGPRSRKGAATRGLSSGSLFPEVMQRPLADYALIAQGGA
jgi:hypothetical protein